MKNLTLQNPKFIAQCLDFKHAIKTIGYVEGSEDTYASIVWEFFSFLEKIGIREITDVRTHHLISYHDYICNRKHFRKCTPLAHSTVKEHLFAIKLLFDHLLDSGICTTIPSTLYSFSPVKYNERPIANLTQIQAIIRCCKTHNEKVILCCAYGCGMRRGEIVRLNVTDLNLKNQTVLIRKGKFGKSRIIPLTDKIVRIIRKYLRKERPKYTINNPEQEAMLVNRRGKRMMGESLSIRFKRIVRRTHDDSLISLNLTLHCLRHSIATHLVQNGATIEFVQQFLGHTDIDSTNIYAIHRKQRTNLIKALNV